MCGHIRVLYKIESIRKDVGEIPDIWYIVMVEEEHCAARSLFGGMVQLALPPRFQDVSDFRPVPDNQEVCFQFVNEAWHLEIKSIMAFLSDHDHGILFY